ncbi:MAG: putative ATPase [Phenylobacterium sp.]|jgi:predicted ATPase
MLTRVRVSAFKSLVNFDLKLSKFNCIIGLNGSGKSTVLQLISYLSSLFQGNTQQWLDARGWESKEVASHFSPNRETIDIILDYSFDDQDYRWRGGFKRVNGICTRERLYKINNEGDNRIFYRIIRGLYTAGHDNKIKVNFKYSGSILSALHDDVIPHEAKRFRDYMASIDSHDLLSPKVMRTGSYSRQGRLGSAGEYLIDHIHRMEKSETEIIRLSLAKYFPQVVKLETKAQSNGTLTMLVTERFYNEDGSHTDIVTDARHINDGMLRLLNILANQRGGIRFQLFDEIENGINPEVTEKLMDSFVGSPQQTLVTTHSPMVLNYLEEDVAVQSVILVYKRKNGRTGAKHLFEIPSAKAKLEELAPGEAMVDLDLGSVGEEAGEMADKEAAN